MHSDAICNHPPCPFYAIDNLYTVDTSPENGSNEMWIGSHLFNSEAQTARNTRGATHILDDFVEQRKKTLPGLQPTVRRGSILFRDRRTWHAGMPNRTNDPRFMIALGFSASWWHGTARFRVPAETGTYERVLHGTKSHGIRPVMDEIPLGRYDELRNVHDFDDFEKRSRHAEIC